MKKFMMMAMAAMMMTMSGNAMAAESASKAPETMEAKSMNIDNANAVRVMLHLNGSAANRFDYQIDGEGNVISKTMYRFDNNTFKWIPVMKYTATYGDDCNTLTFGAYNKADGTFTNHEVSSTYSKDDCPILIALPECMNF